MRRADQYLERAERLRHLAEEAEEQAALFANLPEDTFENGDVIRFDKRFLNGNTWYTYAAIKANGLWYTTGPSSPKAYTWDHLVEWMLSGGGLRDGIWYYTEMERLV